MNATRVCSGCASALPAAAFPLRNGRPITVCRSCLAARARQRRAARRGRLTRSFAAAVGKARRRAAVDAAVLAAVRRLGGTEGFAAEVHRQLAAAPAGSPAALRLILAVLRSLPGAMP